jgi:hypothetical protein
MELVETGHAEFDKDLDIVRMVRRLRMHGIGLYFLLDQR